MGKLELTCIRVTEPPLSYDLSWVQKFKSELTKDSILLAIFIRCIRADEGSEVVVRDLLLVATNRSREIDVDAQKQPHIRVDKLPPAFFPFGGLHPFLVYDTHFRMGWLRKLRECGHGVLEDFIVNSGLEKVEPQRIRHACGNRNATDLVSLSC